MSAQPPESPIATPAQNAEAKRLSDRLITLCGLVLFFAGMVIARLLKHSDDPGLGDDLGDIFKSFGVVLASLGGALPLPDALKRLLGTGAAKVLAALVVGGLLSAGSLMGCALLERREIHTATAPEVTYGVEDGRCVLRGFTDGHETYTAIGPVGEPCPAVTTGKPKP